MFDIIHLYAKISLKKLHKVNINHAISLPLRIRFLHTGWHAFKTINRKILNLNEDMFTTKKLIYLSDDLLKSTDVRCNEKFVVGWFLACV